MSVLNKVPFINQVINDLNDEELASLLNLMNGSGDRTELLRTMNVPSGNRTNISSGDKGVHMCSLQVGRTLYYGYLLYTDVWCVLVHFTDFQTLSIFNIDVANVGIETVSEYLDIDELRGIMGDLVAPSNGGILKTYNAYELLGLTSLLGNKITFTEDKPDEDGGFYYIHSASWSLSANLGIPSKIVSYDLPVSNSIESGSGTAIVMAENIGNSKSKRVCFIGFYEIVPGTSHTYEENATATIKITNFKSIEFIEAWANTGSGSSAAIFPINGRLLNFITDGYVEVMKQGEM